jgi:hypothetical protein
MTLAEARGASDKKVPEEGPLRQPFSRYSLFPGCFSGYFLMIIGRIISLSSWSTMWQCQT